jgi:glyceraldehyde 3-phosphate dehydrogenase
MTVGDTQMVKTVSWYDNENSYVSQLVRTLHYFANKMA